MRRALAMIVFVLASLTPACVFAQGFVSQGGPSSVFADQFGSWSFRGQALNTFTFTPAQSANFCQVSQTQGINNTQFAAFSNSVGYAPVLIYDIGAPSNSEVATPSTAFTNTSTTCGVNLTAVNQHKTFQLQSGTGGLQEALNVVGGSTAPYPTVIYLTPNWYKIVSGISSLNSTLAASTTPLSILTAAKCTSQAYVVDVTTIPPTQWVCNTSAVGYSGTAGNLVVSGATASFPNMRVTSTTQIAAPTALTTVAATCLTNAGGCITTATTGGTIPASAAYTLGATCIDPSGGETTMSIDTAAGATVTVGSGTSTNTITVSSPAGCTAANGAVGWRLYMTAASGATVTEILYSPTPSFYLSYPVQNTFVPSTVMPIGATATISAIITGTAKVPATGTAYPRTLGSSGSYPPFTALGTVNAAATGTLGLINIPAGAAGLNVLGRQLTVCGNGYATTNSTGGTLTLATTLASISGVTSITPFTAVSGTTASSAQADPFDFCVTYTTTATGASGTIEAHGWVLYSLSGTAVGTPAMDIIIAASSTIDLTKQTQLAFTIKPTTTALTAAQLRQVSVVSSN